MDGGTTKRVMLLMEEQMWRSMREAAGKAACSGNAWMREAISRALEAEGGDEQTVDLNRRWQAMTDDGRELLLQHARLILAIPGMRREGFEEPEPRNVVVEKDL